ncbi:MAG TPA: tRNA pseudouridine(38-40) synthase TruA [Acidimicrobiales bacterium]|nr:tRNA pseudouridine(38-40) synthase TruA [Acidimicrobiales bacterium]
MTPPAGTVGEASDEAAPGGPLRRVVLGLAYDGTCFRGFAPQAGERTVAGALGAALEVALGEPVELTCAGRTDAGVHALAQVVHLDAPADRLSRRLRAPSLEPGAPLERLQRSLNRQLAGEVVVWRAELARPGFDARRSALSRRYRYLVDARPRPDPLRRRDTWQVGAALDLAAMRLGADPLIGEHDFSAFCRRGRTAAGPLVRRVLDASWTVLADGRWAFEVEAQAFCQQMVRAVVGMLVAIGRGRARPSDVVARLRSGRREGAPPVAPPHGLALVAVRYPAELGGTFC